MSRFILETTHFTQIYGRKVQNFGLWPPFEKCPFLEPRPSPLSKKLAAVLYPVVFPVLSSLLWTQAKVVLNDVCHIAKLAKQCVLIKSLPNESVYAYIWVLLGLCKSNIGTLRVLTWQMWWDLAMSDCNCMDSGLVLSAFKSTLLFSSESTFCYFWSKCCFFLNAVLTLLQTVGDKLSFYEETI